MALGNGDARMRFIIEAEDRADATLTRAEQRNARLVASSRAAAAGEIEQLARVGNAATITRRQIDDAIMALDRRAQALDGTSRKASEAFDREAQALRRLLTTAQSGAGDLRQLDEIILDAESRMVSFDRTSAIATRRISTGMMEVARTGQLGVHGVQSLLSGVGDLALGLGEGGPLLAAVGIAGVAFYNFWKREQEEANKANEEFEKTLDIVRKIGIAADQAVAKGAASEVRALTAKLNELKAARAEALLHGVPGEAYEGEITRITAQLERAQRTVREMSAQAMKDAADFAKQDNQARIERNIQDLQTRILAADHGQSRENPRALLQELRRAYAEAKAAATDEYNSADYKKVRELEIGEQQFELTRKRAAQQRDFNTLKKGELELMKQIREEVNQLSSALGRELAAGEKSVAKSLGAIGVLPGHADIAADATSELADAAGIATTAKGKKLDPFAAAVLGAMHGKNAGYGSAAADRAAAADDQRTQNARAIGAEGFASGGLPADIQARLDAIAKESKTVEEAEKKKRELFRETYRAGMEGAKQFADVTISSHSRTLRAVGAAANAVRRLIIGAEAADAAVKSAKEFALVPGALAIGNVAGAALHAASGAQLAGAAALGFRESLGGGGAGGAAGGGGGGAPSVGTFRPDDTGDNRGSVTINLFAHDPTSPRIVDSIAYELNRSNVLKRPMIQIPATTGLSTQPGTA